MTNQPSNSVYTELLTKVMIHMKWDQDKAKLWFHTENPLFGGMKPYSLMCLRPEKAKKIIEGLIEENTEEISSD